MEIEKREMRNCRGRIEGREEGEAVTEPAALLKFLRLDRLHFSVEIEDCYFTLQLSAREEGEKARKKQT